MQPIRFLHAGQVELRQHSNFLKFGEIFVDAEPRANPKFFVARLTEPMIPLGVRENHRKSVRETVGRHRSEGNRRRGRRFALQQTGSLHCPSLGGDDRLSCARSSS